MNKLASWEALTGTKPTIESERTIATVSFPLKSAVQEAASSDDAKNVAKNVAKNISERQQTILDLVRDNSTISLDEIAQSIGVSPRTIDREIVKMSHLLRHIGPKKGGSWEIL